MEKNTKIIVGTIMVIGGLVVASKTDNKNINVKIKDDVGDRTMALIVTGIGAYILYKTLK